MPHQYVKTSLEKYLGLSRVKIVDLHQELMSMDFLIKKLFQINQLHLFQSILLSKQGIIG